MRLRGNIGTALARCLGGALACASLSLAGTAEAGVKATPEGFLGVSPQDIPSGNELARMGEGEVGHLRMQVSWAAIEPQAPDTLGPNYDFRMLDRIVLDAARAGIDVLPFVYSTPPWVANELDGRECPFYECYFYAPTSPEALAAWQAFIEALVDRYRPGGELWRDHSNVPARPITAWQIWNEQNSPDFYRPAPNVEDYARLVAYAAQGIRNRDPNAEVVLGGMYGTPYDGTPPAITAWDFLRQFYAIPNVTAIFDGIAAHPYAGEMRGVRAQMNNFIAVTQEVGAAGVDIWVTEIGWSSGGPPDPLNKGRKGQAKSLRKAFTYFARKRRRMNLRNVTWYSWRDNSTGSAGTCVWCPRAGLFEERKLEPKPAWKTFTRFTGGT